MIAGGIVDILRELPIITVGFYDAALATLDVLVMVWEQMRCKFKWCIQLWTATLKRFENAPRPKTYNAIVKSVGVKLSSDYLLIGQLGNH